MGSALMSFADAVWLFCRFAGKCSIQSSSSVEWQWLSACMSNFQSERVLIVSVISFWYLSRGAEFLTFRDCRVQTDVPGVRVRPENKVEWDPDAERVRLPSGKPLVCFCSKWHNYCVVRFWILWYLNLTGPWLCYELCRWQFLKVMTTPSFPLSDLVSTCIFTSISLMLNTVLLVWRYADRLVVCGVMKPS